MRVSGSSSVRRSSMAIGQPVKFLWCLVERPNWEVVDTWCAAGLKGSASNDINVNGVFVPRGVYFEHL